MDMLDEISKSDNRDIVIHVDEKISWLDHIRQIENLRAEDNFFEYIVSSEPKTKKGCKCFLAYKNKIQGSLEIYKIEKKKNKFIIKMFPYINDSASKIDVLSFKEEFRYFYNNSFDQ